MYFKVLFGFFVCENIFQQPTDSGWKMQEEAKVKYNITNIGFEVPFHFEFPKFYGQETKSPQMYGFPYTLKILLFPKFLFSFPS